MVWAEVFIVWARYLIDRFSLLAIFIVSMAGTSTIFMPFPIDTVISFSSKLLGFHPLLVGLCAGMGAAAGELTGYLVGAGSRDILKKRKAGVEKLKKILRIQKLKKTFFKKLSFPIIVVTSFLPFPFDIVGILCGMSNYDIKKFYLAVLIGRVTRAIIIAYAGFYAVKGIEWFVEWWEI